MRSEKAGGCLNGGGRVEVADEDLAYLVGCGRGGRSDHHRPEEGLQTRLAIPTSCPLPHVPISGPCRGAR